MKFAKILLIVSAITLCAINARTVSEAEAEYLAETKAVKAEVGYKELMEPLPPLPSLDQASLAANLPVTLQVEDKKASGESDNTLIKMPHFKSGLPFLFKSAPTEIAKHLIKLEGNSYYIPFNTISDISNGRMPPEENIKPWVDVLINNKNGSFTLKVIFANKKNDFFGKNEIYSILNQWEKFRLARETMIRDEFSRVQSASYYVYKYQLQIDSATKSDADKKKMMEDAIKDTKKKIEDLIKEINKVEKELNAASKTLTTTTNDLQVLVNKRDKEVGIKLSIEAIIKSLKASIKTEDAIKKLEAEKAGAHTNLTYWLKGSVYHRVISVNEMKDLITIALKDKEFDDKINGYFNPQ